MRKDAIVLVVVVLAVSLMITASVVYSRRSGAVPGAPGAKLSALPAEPRGMAAPEFTLANLQGKPVKLSDFRGKAVLLNFWSIYCQPCKIEMPWFEELQKQYGAQGLVVVGVAMDDDGPQAVAKFAKEVGVDYTLLMGKEGVADAYGGVQFLPTTFYLDRDGKIVDRVFGLVSHSEIESNIKKALGSASTATPATAPLPVKADVGR